MGAGREPAETQRRRAALERRRPNMRCRSYFGAFRFHQQQRAMCWRLHPKKTKIVYCRIWTGERRTRTRSLIFSLYISAEGTSKNREGNTPARAAQVLGSRSELRNLVFARHNLGRSAQRGFGKAGRPARSDLSRPTCTSYRKSRCDSHDVITRMFCPPWKDEI